MLLFVDRGGGTYRPGADDARVNTSSLVDAARTIAPWSGSDDEWHEVESCLADVFARFDVTITDRDPGSAPHDEIVFGGRPDDLGMDPAWGGVAPIADDCSVISDAVVFVFADVWGHDTRGLCETAAQELAHAFGLDHERLCADPMTYLGGCGDKGFQDVAARCGEYGDRDCACGDETQDSVAMLRERIGARAGVIDDAPAVAIVSPGDGALVGEGFAIDVNTNAHVDGLELRVDGEVIDGTTSPALALGDHRIEAIASGGGVTTEDAITVTVTDQPPEPAGCSSGGGGGGLVLLALIGLVALRLRDEAGPSLRARRRLRQRS